MKLIMTKGLPGSGKTTWAKWYQKRYPNTVRVNKDDLRAMLHDSVHSHGREDLVLKIRDEIVNMAFVGGHDVIVDDTNLSPKHEARLKQLAETINGAEFTIQSFTDVPVKTCIENDLKRPKPVGKKVIMDMYRRYLYSPTVIEYKKELKDVIVCDLDGTLAIIGDRNPYDASKCMEDYLNGPIFDLIESTKLPLILVSGRKDTYRPQTEAWLKEHKIEYIALHMRQADDNRKDSIVKSEIYETFINGYYNVSFVLDDRNQVVEMWREKGLTCLQVAEGDF